MPVVMRKRGRPLKSSVPHLEDVIERLKAEKEAVERELRDMREKVRFARSTSTVFHLV